jgi:hypothetical protein
MSAFGTSGHASRAPQCLLLGVNRTSICFPYAGGGIRKKGYAFFAERRRTTILLKMIKITFWDKKYFWDWL